MLMLRYNNILSTSLRYAWFIVVSLTFILLMWEALATTDEHGYPWILSDDFEVKIETAIYALFAISLLVFFILHISRKRPESIYFFYALIFLLLLIYTLSDSIAEYGDLYFLHEYKNNPIYLLIPIGISPIIPLFLSLAIATRNTKYGFANFLHSRFTFWFSIIVIMLISFHRIIEFKKICPGVGETTIADLVSESAYTNIVFVTLRQSVTQEDVIRISGMVRGTVREVSEKNISLMIPACTLRALRKAERQLKKDPVVIDVKRQIILPPPQPTI